MPRQLCSNCLDKASSMHDALAAAKLTRKFQNLTTVRWFRLRKFQIYNSEWVQAIEREDGMAGISTNYRGRMAIEDDTDGIDDDHIDGNYGMHKEYMGGQSFANENVFVDDDDDDFGYDD